MHINVTKHEKAQKHNIRYRLQRFHEIKNIINNKMEANYLSKTLQEF